MRAQGGQNLTIRNHQLAADRVKGMTYRELAQKYDISKTTVGEILKKDEIRTIVDGGTAEMVSLIPAAVEVHRAKMQSDNEAIALKASENILKVGTVMPGNVTNQTINNVLNVQNNVTLSPVVAKALLGHDDHDPDIIDMETA